MAGLQALVRLRKEQADLAIVLAAPTPSVRQVIDLAGFTDYFAIYPTPQAAQTALQALAALKLLGQLLKGRYRIESKLGDSQFGRIFIATDIPLNRKVAVTVLSSSFSQRAINQFIYQAQQIMNLNHPHIARVFDSGRAGLVLYRGRADRGAALERSPGCPGRASHTGRASPDYQLEDHQSARICPQPRRYPFQFNGVECAPGQ
jgi:hypothetical protein